MQRHIGRSTLPFGDFWDECREQRHAVLSHTPVDGEIAEAFEDMLTGQLVEQDLAFEPFGVVAAQDRRGACIELFFNARFLARRAQGHREEVDRVVVVEVDAHGDHARGIDGVLGAAEIVDAFAVRGQAGPVGGGRAVLVGQHAAGTDGALAALAFTRLPRIGVGNRAENAELKAEKAAFELELEETQPADPTANYVAYELAAVKKSLPDEPKIGKEVLAFRAKYPKLKPGLAKRPKPGTPPKRTKLKPAPKR